VSFAQFAIGVKSEERLSLSITFLLIIVTQSAVTAAVLPVYRESIWINVLNFVSMIFSLIANAQTIIAYRLVDKSVEENDITSAKEKARAQEEDIEYDSLVPKVFTNKQDSQGDQNNQPFDNNRPVTKDQEHELPDVSSHSKYNKTWKPGNLERNNH
jgi:hypothetical protein